MFGDIGHGFLLLVLGIALCLMNNRLKGTAVEGFGMIRHLILLMGIFAFYNGFIYNEFFAIPTDLFGSCYSPDIMVLAVDNSTAGAVYHNPTLFGHSRAGPPQDCVYPFGMDPRWFESD